MIAHCKRCHVRCRTGTPDPTARLLVISARPDGYCVNCAVADWLLHGSEVISHYLANAPGGALFPGALRLTHIQQQFHKMMIAGGAQVRPEQIDWDEVVANWDLPWPPEKVRAPRRGLRP